MKGDLTIVKEDKFSEGDYFNGLQFRLLQWRFVAEILNENHSWWAGVSPADARSFLDQKYISVKMYTGDPARGDRGYLIYNTHNQFLETILQTGIIGLLIFLFICYSLVKMAWQEKSRGTSCIIGLLVAWLFTESVFETQYGILIFTFFPLFMCLDENRTLPAQRKG
jgi:O-antigen ligase